MDKHSVHGMLHVNASILGFLFGARESGEEPAVTIERINHALAAKAGGFEALHLDIEDGGFVPYTSFTPAMVREIRFRGRREAHLMVADYKRYIDDFFEDADAFIVHQEALGDDFQETADLVRKGKKSMGIAISPGTGVGEIRHLDAIDTVLVMSVNPGMPGQPFMERSLSKIRRLGELRGKHGYGYTIEVDGGIDAAAASRCALAGADTVVMGSHLFGRDCKGRTD